MNWEFVELFIRLPQQAGQALCVGRDMIVEQVSKMPHHTADEIKERFNFWHYENWLLFNTLETMYPKANGNTDD